MLLMYPRWRPARLIGVFFLFFFLCFCLVFNSYLLVLVIAALHPLYPSVLPPLLSFSPLFSSPPLRLSVSILSTSAPSPVLGEREVMCKASKKALLLPLFCCTRNLSCSRFISFVHCQFFYPFFFWQRPKRPTSCCNH